MIAWGWTLLVAWAGLAIGFGWGLWTRDRQHRRARGGYVR